MRYMAGITCFDEAVKTALLCIDLFCGASGHSAACSHIQSVEYLLLSFIGPTFY